MVLPRPTTCTNPFFRQCIRASRRPVPRRQLTRTQRRTYTSENGKVHATHKASSDLPWAITSLVIFVPSLYYLAQPQLNKKKHGGGHGHEDHEQHAEGDQESETPDDEEGEKSEEAKSGEEGEESNEGSGKEGEKPESQDKGDESNQEGNDGDGGQEGGDSGVGDSSESSSDEKQETPDTSADEGSEGSDDDSGKSKMRQVGEQVQWKGPTNATKSGEQEHETVKYPDAKGGTKYRLQSKYGIKLGEQSGEDQSGEQQDHGASSKPAGNMSTQSGKQEGLVNTDTKHSTDITKNPDKSKKAGGMPETAKQKGTVPLDRPLSG